MNGKRSKVFIQKSNYGVWGPEQQIAIEMLDAITSTHILAYADYMNKLPFTVNTEVSGDNFGLVFCIKDRLRLRDK